MFDAVIVGGGPRAVATVLRLVARRPGRPVRVAIVDAVDVGAGATWRIDQPAEFLNNTASGATTIHADESTPMTGPVVPGPHLVDWAAEVAARGTHPLDWVGAEARAISPGSYPSRRVQGAYFRDQLDAAERSGAVEVARVDGTAVDLLAEGAVRTVLLSDGVRLSAPVVVLAQGMVQARPSAQEHRFAEAAAAEGLVYVAPGMPAERDWSRVPAGEDVLVQGLGANFFDVVAVLTRGRGGRFEPVPGDPRGRLRYLPSGREPRLHAGSRRGLPYRSKPDGELPVPPFVARYATAEWFRGLAGSAPGSLDFARDVWPVLAREIAHAHLRAVSSWAPEALVSPWEDVLAALDRTVDLAGVEEVLGSAIAEGEHRFLIDHLRRPTGGEPVAPAQWDALVERTVEAELSSMTHPGAHPRSAVNLAMGALRGPAGALVPKGVVEGRSAVVDVEGWFNADGLFLASGPPSGRTREVLALIDAGVLRLLGPETRVSLGPDGGFLARSAITGNEVAARTLIEPRMSKGKVPNTSDPLLRALLDSGRARVHERTGRDGAPVATESMEATSAPLDEDAPGLNLVAADGAVDERVVVLGIPAQSTQPVSAIGASPGKPSPLLAGADVAARQILRAVAAG